MSKKTPSLQSLKAKKANNSLISNNQDKKILNNQDNKQKKRESQQLIRMYPDAKKQLKMLSVELDTSINDLLNDAINDVFKKHKKPPIA